MELSGRERVALEAICDTLCPSGDGLAGARELGVADALLEAVARNPRAAERRRFGWLLAAWEAKALSALGGGWERFSRLPRGELYYMLPGRGGGHNPAWAAVGYDGPLGSYPEARPKPLVPRAVERDTTLECDVVVVGLGAGGVPVSVDTPEATSAAYLPGPRSSRRSRRSSRRSERRS